MLLDCRAQMRAALKSYAKDGDATFARRAARGQHRRQATILLRQVKLSGSHHVYKCLFKSF
jgi:hypothetical protein